MNAKKSLRLPIFFICFFLFNATAARNIKVKNSITDGMKSYKYLFMKIKPTAFSLSVNNVPIEQHEDKAVPILDNKLNVEYKFEFQNGRKGTRQVEFIVPEKLNKLNILFNWKTKWRVQIKGAEPQSIKEID